MTGKYQPMRNPRVDSNQKEVVQALKAIGCGVYTYGPIDLLVAYRGLWWMLEVKDGSQPESKKRLTKAEIQYILDCKNRAPIYVVESAAQAVELIQTQYEGAVASW